MVVVRSYIRNSYIRYFWLYEYLTEMLKCWKTLLFTAKITNLLVYLRKLDLMSKSNIRVYVITLWLCKNLYFPQLNLLSILNKAFIRIT